MIRGEVQKDAFKRARVRFQLSRQLSDLNVSALIAEMTNTAASASAGLGRGWTTEIRFAPLLFASPLFV